MVLGQALAYAALVVVAQPGVDDGLPGQVAMRAWLGYWGARLLSSPYRIVAASYWFAAQALTAALGFQAILLVLTGDRYPLVPMALVLAVFHALLAVIGFDVTRWLLRIVLPVSLGFTAVLIALFVTSDDPDYAVRRVLDSPDQSLTWVGFATYVTVMCGASLTLVTSVGDYCRYTPTRRDMRIGYIGSALAAAVVTTFVGGYAAAATGEVNPFVAVAEVTSVSVLLVLMLAAIVVQGIAANVTNVYTAGLSVVNTVPRLGRVRATVAAAALAHRALRLPRLHRARAGLDHASRQPRRAARRRGARGVRGRAAHDDRRPGPVRAAGEVLVRGRRQPRRGDRGGGGRRRVLRGARQLGEGDVGCRERGSRVPAARPVDPPHCEHDRSRLTPQGEACIQQRTDLYVSASGRRNARSVARDCSPENRERKERRT